MSPILVSRRSFLTLEGASVIAAGAGLVGLAPKQAQASGSKNYLIAITTTLAPFEFTDENNDFVGIDVELLRGVAKHAGFDYTLQKMTFDSALVALGVDQVDGFMGAVFITDERKKKYDFSDPYYMAYDCCGAKKGGSVKAMEDLAGTTVVCTAGAHATRWAESIKGKYGFNISYVSSPDLMYQGVLADQFSACFQDYPILQYGAQQGNGLEVIAKSDEGSAAPFGFAMGKGKNPELLADFNRGLAAMKTSGELDAIVNKYLGA